MFVFPTPLPRLDIVEASGTTIPLDTDAPVTIQLPFGSMTNRTVAVRAQDFVSTVPISVVVTPDQGFPVTYTNVIDNLSVNPATNVIDIVVPVNIPVRIHAWTR